MDSCTYASNFWVEPIPVNSPSLLEKLLTRDDGDQLLSADQMKRILDGSVSDAAVAQSGARVSVRARQKKTPPMCVPTGQTGPRMPSSLSARLKDN